MLQTLLEVLGYVAAAGGVICTIIGAAWALFMLFGGKWLDARFNQRLEAVKAAQQQELEHLKFRINTLFDRNLKLHEKEFEVVPEAWSKLIDAFHRAQSVTSRLQSYANVAEMRPDELEEFVTNSSLADWQKKEILASAVVDRAKRYQEAISRSSFGKAMEAQHALDDFFSKNGIFIPVALKERFNKLSTMSYDALKEWQLNQQIPIVPRPSKARDALHGPGTEQLVELEKLIQERLWLSSETAADNKAVGREGK